jgi:hypothetical protein
LPAPAGPSIATDTILYLLLFKRKNILNIYKSGKSADFPDLIFHKRGRSGQLNLLLVPFRNSCAAVCETIPATTLFVKTYFENDRSRFQNTNQKNLFL